MVAMATKMTANDVLDREFLQARHEILDIAAALDRIGRADGANAIAKDARMAQLDEAIALLIDGKPDRAERAQMVFSDDYDPNWRES